MNLLQNPELIDSLTNWQVSNASMLETIMDSRFGICMLNNQGYIQQTFFVPVPRAYTITIAVRSVSELGEGDLVLEITNANGDIVVYHSVTGIAGDWFSINLIAGLTAGNYTIKVSLNSFVLPSVYIDEVSIAYIKTSRLEIAQRVHNRLGQLTTLMGFSYDGGDEGSYTQAVTDGLTSVDAVNQFGQVDIRALDENRTNEVVDFVFSAMLEQARLTMATRVDVRIDGYAESGSQAFEMLSKLSGGGGTSGGGSTGTVTVRKMNYEVNDYDL